jgi:hypothetical protein
MNTDQNKTKHISKNSHNNPNKNKKPYRPTFNNDNPHNKLALNKYHQIDEHQHENKKTDSNKLHKRKRDLERMIKHFK